MAGTLRVEIQIASADVQIPKPEALRRWARLAYAAVGDRDAELTIRVVDEDESRMLNERYRGKNQPTNVLSFPFDDIPQLKMPILGDIVICAPVVAREAKAQGKSAAAQWAHMVVHGVMHLCGYDHDRPAAAERMERIESAVLAEIGFPNPYLVTDG